jgi:hypothetical protein
MANTTKTPRIPAEYTPISMWGYFGYSILFSVPIIGWIFVIIFALSASNQNLRNFARSQFCLLIIWIILLLVSCFTGLLASVFSGIKM